MGGVQNELLLYLLTLAVQLVPNGKTMQYDTISEFLVEQWNDMMQWKSIGYKRLDYDACPPQWRKIMGRIEGWTGGIGTFKSTDDSQLHEAARLYAAEGIERLEEDFALPVDAYRRPEAPWFQEVLRREAAGEFKEDQEMRRRIKSRSNETGFEGIRGRERVRSERIQGWRH
jgi:hypothetical protein